MVLKYDPEEDCLVDDKGETWHRRPTCVGIIIICLVTVFCLISFLAIVLLLTGTLHPSNQGRVLLLAATSFILWIATGPGS